MREDDIVAEDVKSTEKDGLGGVESPLLLDESCSRILLSGLEDWSVQSRCRLNDSESEELLNAINPNEMYTPALSESDSGLSESSDEQRVSGGSQPAVYQLVYDISGVGGVIAEPEPSHVDVISIELDEWSSQMLLSDSCVVNELASTVRTDDAPAHDTQDTHRPDDYLVYPDLQLTEEEQKLLDQEGVSLPNNLPLTKAEERILKKVRRKIRNKLSAQDSRRRKKEYIDGLESRVAACSAQNKELQRTVDQLEKHNTSLVAQLHRLQALIKQTATKAAQTSTCIMILLFSLALLIFPSYSPFSRRSQEVEDTYAPSAVISRNILNAVGSAPVPEDGAEDDPALSDPPSAPPELRAARLEPDLIREPRNDTTEPEGDADGSVALTPPLAAGNTDAAKAAHADEM